MELNFVPPDLSALDALQSEVLVGNIWQDKRPCDGIASLYDWRSANRLSQLMKSAYVTGQLGEVLLIPGRKRMSFDKILLFGLGPSDDFDNVRFETVTRAMVRTLDELCAAQVVIELPGRQANRIEPEAAASKLLEIVGESPAPREWTLVEEATSKKRIEKYLLERRHNVRRLD